MRMIAFFFAFMFLIADAEAGHGKEAPKGVSMPTLVEQLARAKKKLAGYNVGTSKIGGDNAVLALWKVGAPELAVVRVRKGRAVTKGFRLMLVERNSANSEYRVLEPDGYVVLAIKTNVAKRPPSRKKRSVAVVYAPYGAHLETPDMRRRGRAHVAEVAGKAIAELDALDVRSLSDPSRRVTASVPVEMLLTLLIIEHINPPDFDARGAEATANRVLALIGANGDDAYDQAFSDTDAGGLSQFRPATYGEIRDAYPAAKLKSDFYVGVRDHVNGVMAQYCYADFTLARLEPEDRQRLGREGALGAYLAAAYNHGLYGAAKNLAAHPLSLSPVNLRCRLRGIFLFRTRPFFFRAGVFLDRIESAQRGDLRAGQEREVPGVAQVIRNVPDILVAGHPADLVEAREIDRKRIGAQRFFFSAHGRVFVEIRYDEFPDRAVDRLAVAKNRMVGF